jgi:2-polyprenyl-3-methyl-5-hydroxy-6-metoxy-1,4-benzoquinol methylase
MEVGCAKGFLLSRVSASALITNAICFEATPGFAEHAKANVQEIKGVHATIFPDTWNASIIDHNSIDLFISSHVLEHFADLCQFLKELYDRMKPGGVVFSEVPNHTPKYVSETFGGQFHLTLTTHRGHLLLMEAVGFQMVDMTLIGQDERTAYPNGYHIRSIFVKPPHKSQTENWKGLGA